MLLAATLAFSAASTAADYQLPELGEPADRSLPLFEERELGAEVFRQIQRYELLLPDHELEAYIQGLGQKLVDASPEARGKPFRFFILRDPSINAFALPGGYIGVHTGLIRAAQTEAELAAVLAHEIAHVTQRHIARQMDQSKGWDIATAALLLAAIAAGGGDPDVVQAALGVGLSMAYQKSVNYTRAHELEADRLGIQTLAAAGFEPQGMEAFFRRLAAQSRLYGEGLPELLRTHPYSTTRMAEARGRVGGLPAGKAQMTSLFGLMRVRAELVEYELAQDKVARFPEVHSEGALEAAYGRAMALRARGQAKEAIQAARSALQSAKAPEQKLVVEMELARALRLNGDGAEATRLLQKLHAAFPLQHATTLALADTLLQQGDAAGVRQMLLESEAFGADVPEVFHLLARAASQMDDPAEVQYQMASWQRARGDWAAAIRQLQRALRDREWDEYEKARLEGRLAGLKASAPESARDELRRERRQEARSVSEAASRPMPALGKR